MERRRGARVRACFAVLGAVTVCVPLISVSASSATDSTDSPITFFKAPGSPSAVSAGPDGALWLSGTGAHGGFIERVTTAGVLLNVYSGPKIVVPGPLVLGPDGAMWFIDGNDNAPGIGRITTGGTVSMYTDSSLARPAGLTVGPDGALWFTNGGVFGNGRPTADKGSIGRISTAGVITNYRDASVVYPGAMTAGPDGALWFVNTGGSSAADTGSIGRISTAGVVTNYTSPDVRYPRDITAGLDGGLWFTNGDRNTNYSIGRITTDGSITVDPSGIDLPGDITAGPDGALWFTDQRFIGRLTTSGSFSYYRNPASDSFGITTGPDGALWFTIGGLLGRITTSLTATAPGNPSADAKSGAAVVQWTAPVSDGASPTDAYEVTVYRGSVAQRSQLFNATATTATVRGLTNGVTYEFRIAAHNANGVGTWSDSTLPITIGPPSSWQITPSPTPSSGSLAVGIFNGVSCTAAANCFAVGLRAGPSGANEPLIERWNGKAWTVMRTPNPPGPGYILNGVSCASPTRCVAVGTDDDVALAESWDGTRWSITPVSGPSELFGVSCVTGTQCFAVGNGNGSAAIERWNGHSWSNMPPPRGANSYLTSVSCVSTKACIATGSPISPTALRWNGTSWSIIPTPRPADAVGGSLNGVACVSTTSCLAVGQRSVNYSGQSLTWIARWNGTSWSTLRSANAADFFVRVLNAVSCTSSTSCVAVGTDQLRDGPSGALIEHWNGKSWSLINTPQPADHTLNAVSCTTATDCVAVGAIGARTLVEQSSGK